MELEGRMSEKAINVQFQNESNDLPGAPKAVGAAAGAPNGVAGAGLPNGAGVGARNSIYQYDVSVLRT